MFTCVLRMVERLRLRAFCSVYLSFVLLLRPNYGSNPSSRGGRARAAEKGGLFTVHHTEGGMLGSCLLLALYEVCVCRFLFASSF